MRNILILIFSMVLFIGCTDQGILSEENSMNRTAVEENYKVIEIEDCEYILYQYTSGYSGHGFLAHKGNCSNPHHKDNQ